jgi:hypothetical protein
MTNTYNHAKNELEILISSVPDAVVKPFKDEILSICEKFGNSGQSGGSAPYTASIISETIKKLFLHEPISPITGDDNEWICVSHISDGEILYQNKRDGAIFKDGSGKAYYTDAIIKKDQNNIGWSGSFWLSNEDYLSNRKDLKIKTRGYIKSFPFTPKTFYINVTDIEVKKDDWESFINDVNDLNEVKEYYHLNLSDFRDEKINTVIND